MEKQQPRKNVGIRDQTAAESMAPSCTMQCVVGAGGLMGFCLAASQLNVPYQQPCCKPDLCAVTNLAPGPLSGQGQVLPITPLWFGQAILPASL